MNDPHIALKQLRLRLRDIYEAISNYRPRTVRLPVIYPAGDTDHETLEDGQYLQQDNAPGFKKLKDSIRIDLDVLEKFLDDSQSLRRPPISTNAPYLIAVWNEILCAHAPVEAIFRSIPQAGPSAQRRQRGNHRADNVKVDVVTDYGKTWIRINTVKNSRLLAEFREIDSYLTDSDDSSNEDMRPSLAQTEFDNSVLRMGRYLIAAAKANPIESTAEIPQVTLRLTRLNPSSLAQREQDPRIAKTVQMLQEMGVCVVLGERQDDELSARTPAKAGSVAPITIAPLSPTTNINLDLSVLIALVSDITHAPLPATVEEADKRFIPPDSYREWKKEKAKKSSKIQVEPNTEITSVESSLEGLDDYAKHSRALTLQLLQEMKRGMLQEVHDKISILPPGKEIKFWTTAEARGRCLRIIDKIGGPSERRRAHALFWTVSTLSTQSLSLAEAEDLYWQDSRYISKFVPLFPIYIHSTAPNPLVPEAVTEPQRHSFFNALAQVCGRILAQDTIPHRRNISGEVVAGNQTSSGMAEIQRANVTKVNPRLTAHTVQSLLQGAELGWTTLTANKSSIKMILREMKLSRVFDEPDLFHDELKAAETRDAKHHEAAIWVVDPRSLAEGMSSHSR